MQLTRDDGTPVTAVWKPILLGFDIPELVVDDKTVEIAPPLKWYEWAWCVLPLTLVIIGGLAGAFLGVLAFTLNAKIFRSELQLLAKYILAAGVTLCAVLIWFFLSVSLSSLVAN